MTITTDPGRWTFTAAGATGSFQITKPVFDVAALACYAVSTSSSAIYAPTYTVTLAADRSGATVDVTAGLTLGDKVVVFRVPYRTQAQPFSASGPLPPKIVERGLDRITADISALYEMVRRTPRFPLADDTVAPELAIASQRAGKLLGWGVNGEWSVIAGLPSVPVSGAMSPVVQAASLGAGLTALGFSAFMQTLIGAASETALLAAAGLIAPFHPTGRLTLASGVPVMTSDQTAKTVVYWTPYRGLARAPVWNGTRYVAVDLVEASNDLTSAAANVGAAAAQPYSCYDFFLDSAGRLYRGPRWRKAQTFTVTSASPGVFTTGANHNFTEGQPVYLETTGALYTGLAVLTPYFVHVLTATTFNVSTSLANWIAGTYVNTSGSQSGVHTVATFVQERGTGAGTAELETLNGIPVNKYAMTNGPVARFGTYVGTGLTNASSQIDFKFGSRASGFGEATVHLWNAYNRVDIELGVYTSTTSWTAGATFANGMLIMNSSATARASVVSGLPEDGMSAAGSATFSSDGVTTHFAAIAFRGKSLTTAQYYSPQPSEFFNGNGGSVAASLAVPPFLGHGFMAPLDGYTNSTSGLISTGGPGTGMTAHWRY